MHKLLQRQLKRQFGSLEAVPAGLRGLLEAVDEAYRQNDADRNLLERSMELASAELRRHYEEQLQRSQKMEGMGRLAGGVAHDFNNILTVIRGHCELMESYPDLRVKSMEELLRAVDRARDLTRQLLAFSRRQVLKPRLIDLNTLVTQMQSMLRPLIGENVELVTLLDPKIWRIKADPGQVSQVIMNLVVNARDAMAGGGRILVKTANVTLDEATTRQHGDSRPGPYAMLSVSDTGHGMDAVTKAHLFEPFYTTKDVGKGTGLGLSTVFGIVKQSDGLIRVESEPGEGTSFFIYLPRVDILPATQMPTPPPPQRLTGSETILVVEDNAEVRSLICETLRSKGYSVLDAPGGEEALKAAAGREGAIALLLTDVVMPGMTGTELAKRLTASRAGLRVLFISGYTDDPAFQRDALGAGATLLEKPFSAEELAQKVRMLLNLPVV